MKIELSEQEENAEEVIKKWQESCNALEEKNNELLQSLESSGSADGEFKSDVLSELQAKLAETEKSLADARDALGNDDDILLQWQGESNFASYRSLLSMKLLKSVFVDMNVTSPFVIFTSLTTC